MRLKDKVAIITGAAGGIGEVTAETFAKAGARLVIVDLKKEDVNKTVEKIHMLGGEAIGIEANVTKREQVERLMNDTVARFGCIDIVINNAGITQDSQLIKMSEEQWDNVINVNLKGVFNVGQLAAKVMVEQKKGVILNASSVVGVYGNFGQTNYAATKFGVNGMTKTWAKELGKYGIRVNSVAPGFIATPMTEKMPEKILEMMKNKSPLRRMGTPEDIANCYLYLASDEANFITGAVINIDGGAVL